MTKLTRQVLRYQAGDENLEALLDDLQRFVYEFPLCVPGYDAEDGAELLLRIMPRVHRLISSYRETGKSFEHYLASTLRWQLRSIATERARTNTCETALCSERQLWGVHEDETQVQETPDPPDAGQSAALSSGEQRHLLYFALKLAERLDESDYRRVARAVGYDAELLIAQWQSLREICRERRDRKREFARQRDYAWFQLRCIQFRLQLALDSGERAREEHRLAYWRRRHHFAARRLRCVHPFPTHEDIANVLNVPKGSVDSSVFYGKRRLQDPQQRKKLVDAVLRS